MRFWASALSILVLTSFSVAVPRHIFVGGAGCWGGLGEEHNSSTDGHVSTTIRFNDASGFHVETGLAGSFGQVYAGFQEFESIHERESTFSQYYNLDRDWNQSDRLLVGYRLVNENPHRVRALIGISVSWGWMRRSKSYEQAIRVDGELRGGIHASIHQTSKASLGVGGELGCLIPLYRSFNASLIGRLDVINSQIGSRESHWMEGTDRNYLANIQLGLQYHFLHESD